MAPSRTSNRSFIGLSIGREVVSSIRGWSYPSRPPLPAPQSQCGLFIGRAHLNPRPTFRPAAAIALQLRRVTSATQRPVALTKHDPRWSGPLCCTAVHVCCADRDALTRPDDRSGGGTVLPADGGVEPEPCPRDFVEPRGFDPAKDPPMSCQESTERSRIPADMKIVGLFHEASCSGIDCSPWATAAAAQAPAAERGGAPRLSFALYVGSVQSSCGHNPPIVGVSCWCAWLAAALRRQVQLPDGRLFIFPSQHARDCSGRGCAGGRGSPRNTQPRRCSQRKAEKANNHARETAAKGSSRKRVLDTHLVELLPRVGGFRPGQRIGPGKIVPDRRHQHGRAR